MNSIGPPPAYFITFSCYGTRLHGDDRGSVDLEHNQPGAPLLPANPVRKRAEERSLAQPPYSLDDPRRQTVLTAVLEVVSYRGWVLLAAHVRTEHVHAVVSAACRPERVLNDLKAYASRALNRTGLDGPDRLRWTRHGSTRYLWKPDRVRAAIDYVVRQQGDPMAVFEADPRVVLEVVGVGED